MMDLASRLACLEDLTADGPRVVGTAEADRAADVIRDRMGNMGYAVDEQTFSISSWSPGSARFEVSAPAAGALECQPLMWSVPTPTGGVEGTLVAMGHTRLWDGSISWRKLAAVQEDRVLAYVLVNDRGAAIMQPCPRGSDSEIPHVAVGRDDGKRIQDWLATGADVTVRLDVSPAHHGAATGRNIVARRASRRWPAEDTTLICAHYDTVYGTPGAYDNASGVVVLLDLAERLITERAPDVTFAFFGGEEWHLAGSRTFVASLSKNGLPPISMALNIDGIGRGDLLEVGVGPEWLEWAVFRALQAQLADTGLRVQTTFPPLPASDHAAFYDAGIPAAHLTINDWPLLHRPDDRPDPASARNMGIVADLAEALVRELPASLPPEPRRGALTSC